MMMVVMVMVMVVIVMVMVVMVVVMVMIIGHEFEQTLGDNGGQRSLVCCSPRGLKEM